MSGWQVLTGGPWVVAVALGGAALLAWAAWLEGRPAAPWRRLALVVAVACLVLLALRPARRVAAAPGAALLVTPGAEAGELTELPAEVGAFALPGAAAGSGEPVPDAAFVAREHPEVNRWLVAGVGLPPWQLDALSGSVERVAPAPPGPGIDRVAWQRRLPLGETLRVTGTWQANAGAAAEPVEVALSGPGGVEDRLAAPAPGSFTLEARPRREGRWLYRLSLEAGGARLAEETLDVEVTPRDPPHVLWLEGAPGFETRQVKTWLGEVGGALVLRSRVSRGRYRYEYLNHPRVAVERLSPELLRGFDVLVVDAAGWEDLTAGERSWARQAVAEGLGALALPGPGADVATDALWRDFPTRPVADLDDIEVRLSGPGLAALEPLVVPARELEATPAARPLLVDASGRWLAAVAGSSLGRVARTLVPGTERWVLRGAAASHRLYWRQLLDAVARVPPRAAAWLPAAGPVLRDRPLELVWIGEATAPPRVTAPSGAEMTLAPAQDADEPRRWRATMWPGETGWHRVDAANGAAWFHVLPPTAWSAWQQRAAGEATRRRSVLGAPARVAAASGAASRVEPWPHWPLFLLLLAAWTSLWAHEQWMGRTESGRMMGRR